MLHLHKGTKFDGIQSADCEVHVSSQADVPAFEGVSRSGIVITAECVQLCGRRLTPARLGEKLGSAKVMFSKEPGERRWHVRELRMHELFKGLGGFLRWQPHLRQQVRAHVDLPKESHFSMETARDL